MLCGRPRDFSSDTAERTGKAKSGINQKIRRAEQLAAHSKEVEAYIAKKAEQRQPVMYTEAIKAVQKSAKQSAPREPWMVSALAGAIVRESQASRPTKPILDMGLILYAAQHEKNRTLFACCTRAIRLWR